MADQADQQTVPETTMKVPAPVLEVVAFMARYRKVTRHRYWIDHVLPKLLPEYRKALESELRKTGGGK